MAKTDYSVMQDESLMERIQSEDHQAFRHLLDRHTNRFYRAAYRICQNEMEAEDILQEAFLKIWDRPQIWKKGKGAKFTTWFYRMVVNMSIDTLRRRKGQIGDGETVLNLVEDSGDLPDSQVIQGSQVEALERAIKALPEQQNIALNLCFYEGLKNKEAAEVMGIKLKALESLLMRAKANIRDDLIRTGFIEEEEQAHG